MASPQTENGFFKMSTELFDALVHTKIAGGTRQILDAIIRMTYGYHHTWQEISLNKFRLMTGLTKSHICRHIKLLITMQIIITKIGYRNLVSYRIQKDYTKWKSLPKMVTNHESSPKMVIPITKNGYRTPRRASKDKGLQNPKDNVLKIKEYVRFLQQTFSDFYSIYRKKEGKKDALKAWTQIWSINNNGSSCRIGKLSEDRFKEIISILSQQNKQKWNKTEMKYIPLPASWLRGHRWNDELTYKEDWRKS